MIEECTSDGANDCREKNNDKISEIVAAMRMVVPKF